MKLFVKYMVSTRCKMVVKDILRKLGYHFILVDLGEVEVMEELSSEQLGELKKSLHHVGFELMDDKKAILIERIKIVIVELVHYAEDLPTMKFSDYLGQKLNHDYTYMANLFSDVQGTTIEQYMIGHKIERIKELIIYGELNITEIAYKMNYSSVSHMSSQFKKVTGLSPSHFKNLKGKKRNPINEI